MTVKRRTGRRVAISLLWTVTAILVLLGVLIAAGGAASAGLVFVFLLAVFTGSAAMAVARTGRDAHAAGLAGASGRRVRRHAALPKFAEPAARVETGGSLLTLPDVGLPTRYIERHSSSLSSADRSACCCSPAVWRPRSSSATAHRD